MKPLNPSLQFPMPQEMLKDMAEKAQREMRSMLRSKRDLPLIFTGRLMDLAPPVVTVELYVKWYSLYVVKINYDELIIEEVPFPDDIEFCKGESAYCDHVPNPRIVARWAEKNGYRVDELAMEVIIGRWELESRGNYNDLWSQS